jgi:hypothetical protein
VGEQRIRFWPGAVRKWVGAIASIIAGRQRGAGGPTSLVDLCDRNTPALQAW